MRSRNTRCEYGPPPGKPGGGFFVWQDRRFWVGGTRSFVFCRGGVPPPPGRRFMELAVLLAVIFRLCCLFHPISLVLPKETGWSPKEKRFWAGTDAPTFRPRPPLPLAFGARVRPLRCPLRGRSQFGRSAPRERVKMPPEAAFLIELTGRRGRRPLQDGWEFWAWRVSLARCMFTAPRKRGTRRSQ